MRYAMNKFIELISVGKVYGKSKVSCCALKNIELSVAEGEYCTVIGPSGSGKSTLLHIMGGLDVPSSGLVRFRGENVAKLGEKQLCSWRNRNIGFVFQFYHLIEELSVLENIALPSLLTRMGRKTSFKKARKLLQYLDIEEKEGMVPSQLSGGEKQKAAIARALMNDPELILCDEPTGNLDSASCDKVISLLEGLHRNEKKTLVIVTHNVEIAKRAQKLFKLRGGELVAQ
jgi:ABC-type lipoprotein export system ATPase subunit